MIGGLPDDQTAPDVPPVGGTSSQGTKAPAAPRESTPDTVRMPHLHTEGKPPNPLGRACGWPSALGAPSKTTKPPNA